MSTRSRSIKRLRAVTALAGAALLLAACGGDDEAETGGGGGTSTGGASGELSGDPIVVYTFADVVTQGPQYKNIQETSRIATEWLNDNGGIKGRPVEGKFCDTKGSPTAAAACARQAVSDKAVAVVGSYNFAGDAEVPILEAAKTAWFAPCCSNAPSEFKSPVSFPLGDVVWTAALVSRAVDDNCQQIGGVVIEGAEFVKPIMDNAAKAKGTKIAKYITLPATARDYSPQVAQATSGTDCLIMIVSETPFTAWMPAFAQSGAEQRMYGLEGNLNPKVAKGFEKETDGDIVASYGFSSITLEPWKDFRESIDKYKAAGTEDYDSPGGKGTWAAYMAFRQVVEGMDGEINNQTFLEAANTAKIDLPGMVPPVDFSSPWGERGGLKGYERAFSTSDTFSKLENGKLVPVTTEFEDFADVALGKASE